MEEEAGFAERTEEERKYRDRGFAVLFIVAFLLMFILGLIYAFTAKVILLNIQVQWPHNFSPCPMNSKVLYSMRLINPGVSFRA